MLSQFELVIDEQIQELKDNALRKYYWRVVRARSVKEIGWIETYDGIKVDHPRSGLKALSKIAIAHNQAIDYLHEQLTKPNNKVT